MTWRLNICKENHGCTSPSGYRGHTKLDSNPDAQHLLNFKMGIKREVSQYTILEGEKHFEAFKRNLLATATTHSCEEVLDPLHITRHDEDSQELFQQNNTLCTVSSIKVIQSDMGKNIVRKYVPILDAQSVWTEFESQMSTSSRGLNERCRLHGYVSTTVYDSCSPLP